MTENIKRAIFKITITSLIPILALWNILSKKRKKGTKTKFGLVNIEYFHENAGGFGGFGHQ